jgi:hypothetical protein
MTKASNKTSAETMNHLMGFPLTHMDHLPFTLPQSVLKLTHPPPGS